LNKSVVMQFNREFIEQGNLQSLDELVADDFYNHTAVPGVSKGRDGMLHFLQDILRAGFPDLKVEILEQVAERDLVTTRKKITGTHTGKILGIAPSHRTVTINIMDFVRLRNGQYIEHWGVSNFGEVIAELRAGS